MNCLLAATVVAQEDKLMEPHRCDDKRPVARPALYGACLQVGRLDDTLEEQLYRLLAKGVEVILPTAPFLR